MVMKGGLYIYPSSKQELQHRINFTIIPRSHTHTHTHTHAHAHTYLWTNCHVKNDNKSNVNFL